MPKIVIEGPDGAGKTTLTEMLRERIRSQYFAMIRHSCRPLHFGDAFQFYSTLVTSHPSMTLLVDRHPMISEPIYGPILRGSNLLASLTPQRVMDMIAETTDVLVYCRPPLEVIEKNLSTNPQLAGVRDKIKELVEAYDSSISHLQRNVPIPVYRYDWTAPDAFHLMAVLLFGSNYRERP